MIEFAADTTIRINIFLCIIGMRYLVPLIICCCICTLLYLYSRKPKNEVDENPTNKHILALVLIGLGGYLVIKYPYLISPSIMQLFVRPKKSFSTLPSHMLSPAKAAARQQYFDAMSRRKLGLW